MKANDKNINVKGTIVELIVNESLMYKLISKEKPPIKKIQSIFK